MPNRSESSSSRSPLERKESLRAVLDLTRNIRNVDDVTVKNLENIVKEADVISSEVTIEEKVVSHDEVLMDSEVMAASSRVLKSSACLLTKEISPFNTRDYVAKLLQYVHTDADETLDAPDWSILENEVSKAFKRTPNYTLMSGYLQPLAPKVTVKHQRVKRDALAPIKRPDAIVELTKDDDSVEETVAKIKRIIFQHHRETESPMEFWKLVVDPRDFGKTVENMLHVSFLARDGLILIRTDSTGTPMVEPTTKEMKSQAKKSGKQKNTQNLFSITPEQWQLMINKLNIDEPMIDIPS